MKLAVTGGTGAVGRFIVEEALRQGDAVQVLGRTEPGLKGFSRPVAFQTHDLSGPAPALDGCDALVHAAFSHVPGRYRGGEGEDPKGFLRANVDGSLRVFEAARSAGIRRIVFLSSRAVYGDYSPGTPLPETLPPRPDTLYGRAKFEVEQALAAMIRPGLRTVSLRATGVYGCAVSGMPHKWTNLFRDFRAGEDIAPRVATEVHGRDLAAAVRLALTGKVPPVLNVSDLLLDRRYLLREVARLTGCTTPLPQRADAGQVSVMPVDALAGLGWRPGGVDLLRRSLPGLLDQAS
ncbi:nucleoside-diphosphate-sugar epimerase [Aliiruegeria haliotis]|uniref:Nucleoside-diphosphate-sugar epimerase n=1 Tax=Aliiruegeria haliotis TaxID=1280846 RepID=A0A2T0RR40_9RHOB|nr:NAD(P)-dependent oxidoreductase [Aliiruegeria haliotis]PRY23665.1 nucleoside-diphosphate-sugar epimerase [Aliiruegeria haliotis]